MLLEQLIDSLDPGSNTNVEEAWMQEVERRAAELDSGAVHGIAWDVVRTRPQRTVPRSLSL